MLEDIYPIMMTTKEVAAVLRRTEQRLKVWAMTGKGPIQPVRIHKGGGPLLWRRDDVERLISSPAFDTADIDK